MHADELTAIDHELASMSRLWRAFLARMFLDVLDHRKRIRTEAEGFWADQEHLEYICELAMIPVEPMSDCYDLLNSLPKPEQMPYATQVRDALTRGFLLPTKARLERATLAKTNRPKK